MYSNKNILGIQVVGYVYNTFVFPTCLFEVHLKKNIELHFNIFLKSVLEVLW